MKNRMVPVCLAVALLAPSAQPRTSEALPAERAQETALKEPKGFVLGIVADAVSGKPIESATVTLNVLAPGGDPNAPAGTVSSSRRSLTDAQGRFLFRNLGAGSLVLTATASGYLEGSYGQRRPGSSRHPLVLGENQQIGDVSLRLWKEARLSGTVMDEHGDPLVDVAVSLARRRTVAGRTQWTAPLYSSAFSTRTDDRGAYWFGGVEPGDYVVSVPTRTTAVPISAIGTDGATPASLRASGLMAMPVGPHAANAGVRLGDFVLQTSLEGTWGGSNALTKRLPFSIARDGRVTGYATTFFPSARAASSAVAISVKAGDERSNIDIEMRPVAMARVSGTLAGPSGPVAHAAVHLVPEYAVNQPLERTHEAAVTTTDARGAFTFPAVAPGQYLARAWKVPQVSPIGRDPLPADSSLWVDRPVTVDEAATVQIALTLEPGSTFSGRLEFDGAAPHPPMLQLQSMLAASFEPPSLLPFGGNLLPTRVTEAGDFTTISVPPGAYQIKTPSRFSGALKGWYLESATWEGKDLSVAPITVAAQTVSGIAIRFSDRPSILEGSVTDANGNRNPEATIVLFPADYRAWIQNGMLLSAMRSTTVTPQGTYSIGGLKPGDYLAAALIVERVEDLEPSSIEAITARAIPMTLTRGETKRLDLKTR